MRSVLCAVLATSVAACGGMSTTSSPDAPDGPVYVTGFNPPPVMDGYTRYVTPTIPNIAPGADVEYCQWIAAPADSAQDVLAFIGEQSAGGHHAVVYSTTETQFATGESHLCTTDDMLSISFVGAIGGEGNNSALTKLPDGLFFRLPAGHALMANTHWLNTTDSAVDGQAVIDIEFTPASDTRTTADIFANNGDLFSIPAGSAASYDVTCPIGADLNMAMVTNHMHNDGVSAYSEVIHSDGSKDMIVEDTTWASDEQFNPVYKSYSVAAPLVLKQGDQYHTHCEWLNQTSKTLLFPDEMCVGQGFYFPSQGQIACSDGGWPTN